MKRVLMAVFKQEVGSFNPQPTRYDDFEIRRGAALIDDLRGTNTSTDGVIEVFTEHGAIEMVPTYAAWARVCNGLVVQSDLDRLIDELLAEVRKTVNIDGACICMHGAMAGDTESDPEGRVLAGIRAHIGDAPMVINFDLHGVFSDRMVDAADAMVLLHTYPHVDMRSTGRRSAEVLLDIMEKGAKPTSARVQIPLLARGDQLITATGKFGEALKICQEIEASESGLAAGINIGNPFTDTPDLRSNVFVTTNADPERAEREALRLARFMWTHRALFVADLTPLKAAVRLAEETDGLTVFSDAADSTASGASGDSNAILRGLLDYNYSGRALVPLVDAPAVEAAHAGGVGFSLSLCLGGSLDRERFSPLQLEVYVQTLSDGQFTYEGGLPADGGRSAVLIHDNLTILATERSVFSTGLRIFQAHGLEPTECDLVVCKSPNGFRIHYGELASRIVAVDVPGSTSANLKTLPYAQCPRPIFPLDEGVLPPFPLED